MSFLNRIINKNEDKNYKSHLNTNEADEYSPDEKMIFYKEKAKYLNSLLKYAIKFSTINNITSENDVSKYSQLNLALDLIYNLSLNCEQGSIVENTQEDKYVLSKF